MTEDAKLTELVKTAMEEGVVLKPSVLKAIETAAIVERRRSVRPLMGLLAASLVLALGFWGVMMALSGGQDSATADAIGLLCELDGFDDDDFQNASSIDKLLAWQEAPCAETLAIW